MNETERKCSHCGRKPARPNRVLCLECALKACEYSKQRSRANKEAGLCAIGAGTCKKRPVRDRTMCRAHLDDLNKRQKRRANERREAGICRTCKKPLPVGRLALCMECQPTKDGKTNFDKRQARQKVEAAEAAQDAAERAARNAKIANLIEAYKALPLSEARSRQLEIVSLRCGLGNEKDRSLEEVSQQFGISGERVRQIELKILGVSLRRFDLNPERGPGQGENNGAQDEG